jgi:hypothetical protein
MVERMTENHSEEVQFPPRTYILNNNINPVWGKVVVK